MSAVEQQRRRGGGWGVGGKGGEATCAPFVSLICAVRSATADAGSSSPSHPFVLFLRFLDRDADELSSVSREGESARASVTSVVGPVVTTCAVSGGSTESSRLRGRSVYGAEGGVGGGTSAARANCEAPGRTGRIAPGWRPST